ncbi:MAG: hypothetical protein ACHQYQ_02130 [Bacteriovoracales bacterium]
MKKSLIGLTFFFLFIDLAISAPPTVCMVTTVPNNPLQVGRVDCDPVAPPFTNKSTLFILKNIKGAGGLRNLSVTTLGNSLIYTLDNL